MSNPAPLGEVERHAAPQKLGLMRSSATASVRLKAGVVELLPRGLPSVTKRLVVRM